MDSAGADSAVEIPLLYPDGCHLAEIDTGRQQPEGAEMGDDSLAVSSVIDEQPAEHSESQDTEHNEKIQPVCPQPTADIEIRGDYILSQRDQQQPQGL